MIYIGIDNGVSGSISIIDSNKNIFYFKTPVIRCLNYTKEKGWIHRINIEELIKILEPHSKDPCKCLLERPMVNPRRFKASTSALRALEATLIVLEQIKMPYQYIDSKEWQKKLLPNGLEGSDELKKASKEVAKRLFPNITVDKDGDADSLLIAEFARIQGNE